MDDKFLFVCFICIALAIQGTQALLCYSCSQSTNPDCAAKLATPLPSSLKKVQCDTACITYTDTYTSGMINRGCLSNSWVPDELTTVSNTCIKDDFSNDIYCSCNTIDFCNTDFKGNMTHLMINECSSAPCMNAANCIDLYDGFSCQCVGNWIGPQCSQCKPGTTGRNCELSFDICTTGVCQNNAKCNSDATTNKFTCICAPGFADANCATRLDACESRPCMHGGQCANRVDTFGADCTCDGTGYQGATCADDVNECANNALLCKPNGACVNLMGSYRCDCNAGFNGNQCEINIDECASQPCLNNGVCVDGDNSFTCNCLAGYAGKNCETNIDECSAKPCKNNGVCQDAINDYTCVCPVGFNGKNCEANIDDCTPNPCSTSGSVSCSDLVNDYTCKCIPGYTGKKCDQLVDNCRGVACANNAICSNQVNAFRCMCDPRYFTGTYCEVTVNRCVTEAPCQNGATCSGGLGMSPIVCTCKSGFKGDRCQTKITACDSQPCKNGGICTDQNGGVFSCDCSKTAFVGQNCDDSSYCASAALNCNFGTCTNDLVNKVAKCACNRGYTGTNCLTMTKCTNKEMRFTDDQDCSYYFICKLVNGVMQQQSVQCPLKSSATMSFQMLYSPLIDNCVYPSIFNGVNSGITAYQAASMQQLCKVPPAPAPVG